MAREGYEIENKVKLKPGVNRRISELKAYTEILKNLSKEARNLQEQYEKEAKRVEEDYDSIGLENPDKASLDKMKDDYLLAEDKVNDAKNNLSKLMEDIKKNAEKLAKNASGLESETAKLEELKEEREKAEKNANLKLESKKRRLEMLDGTEKNELQQEIDMDEENLKAILVDYDDMISKQEKSVKNIQEAALNYEAYREEYNKYAKDKLGPLEQETIDIEESSVEGPEIEENSGGTENPSRENAERDNSAETPGEHAPRGRAERETENPSNEYVSEEFKIESKEDFEAAYNKLSKGLLKREQRNVLYKVLEDESNFEKFGITTGLLRNRSRVILKAQGNDMNADIMKFIKESGRFSGAVKYDFNNDKRNDKENSASTEDLKHWGQLKRLGKDGDRTLNIEEYIAQIEEYKEHAEKLTPEQEKIYGDAIFLKSKLGGFKQSLTNFNEVKEKNKKEGFLRNLFYEKTGVARLPENIEIREDHEFSKSLGDMVNSEDISRNKNEEELKNREERKINYTIERE